jgi:ferredoxin
LKDSLPLTKMDVQPIEVDDQICLVCGACVGICPANAMCLENDQLKISEELCTFCGRCVLICPVRALHQGVASR